MKGKRGHIDPHQKKVLSKSPTLFVLTAIHSYFYHLSKACNCSVCVHCVRGVFVIRGSFYKIGVLKTSAKFVGKKVCRDLLSIKLQTFSLSRLLLIFRILILNKFVHLINIVDKLYLMGRNVDFTFDDPKKLEKHISFTKLNILDVFRSAILWLGYYETIFNLKILDICL